MTEPQRVAVIGSGCAGLAAAWHLNRSGVDVTLFESASWVGGHANTITVDGVDVDTGFMVYNAVRTL
jgi:cyclopropane-fatty-acyl-phospholipid synthase